MNNLIYEFTRTIRFNLIGEDIEKIKISLDKLSLDDDSLKQNLEKFLEKYEKLIDGFKNTLFNKNDKIKPYFQIKKSWLRNYAREIFYELNEKERNKNKFSVETFKSVFNSWFDRNKQLADRIQECLNSDEFSRKSDVLFYLIEIKTSDNFGFIENLLAPGILNDKNSEDSVNNLRLIFNDFKETFQNCLFLFSSNFFQGIEIERASLNYYTINKISKNFDKDIEQEKNKLFKEYQLSLEQKNFLEKIGFFQNNNNKDFSLEKLYSSLKKFKSQQKSKFMEIVSEIVSKQDFEFNSLMKQFPLFNIEKYKFDKFLESTKKIKSLSQKKNYLIKNNNNSEIEYLDKEIRDIKIKRGEFFQKDYFFKNYVDYCDKIFEPIAKIIGNIKAKIRALEQEKVEARLLKYWAHILKKDNNYFLLLIPKDKRNEAKEELKKIRFKKGNSDSDYSLYSFNSLTLRALKKLIRRNLGKEQTRLQNDAINLYKEVLKGKYYNKLKLDFSGFKNQIQKIISKDYKSEEDFRIALEKVSYVVFENKISQKDIDNLREKFDALFFQIASYDLLHKVKKIKEHTILWSRFWSLENKLNQFPIRLNPEIRIYFRPAQNILVDQKSKNRFSKDNFLVAFTLTENSATQKMDLAFLEEKELLKKINKFNEEIIQTFIQKNKDNLYFYGIDRGQRELATLGIVRFSQKEYEVFLDSSQIKKIKEPLFPPIELYKIKEDHLLDKKEIVIDKKGNKKEIILFQNPSYFIDNEEILEEVESSFIDLTTAKLIKGKIILNGDLNTYLKLKLVNSKRQLFDKLPKIDESAQIEFDEEKKQFKIKSKEGEREEYQLLPFYNHPQLEIIKNREEFKKELQNYLEKLKNSSNKKEDYENITFEKINHLRDALTSNIVGIIFFLFQKYPGIINLENLVQKEHIKRHFIVNNENISRRLEWALYKKFQKLGLVPPQLRQTVLLREKFKDLKQIGIIHFVKTEGTSAICPYCQEQNIGRNRREYKFRHNRFVCFHCGFDTFNPPYNFKYIKNSDDVAAYNIAKLGTVLVL